MPIIIVMKQTVLSQIHGLLLKKQKTIAAAESCTGGIVDEMLTRYPGSSGYFILGIIPYSNKAKTKILGVPASLILKKGAVSLPVAVQMAKAVRKLVKADLGIGITGTAGPGAGTPQQPVGTVFIAIDSKNRKLCRKFIFKGSRSQIRKQAALKALELLTKLLTTDYLITCAHLSR